MVTWSFIQTSFKINILDNLNMYILPLHLKTLWLVFVINIWDYSKLILVLNKTEFKSIMIMPIFCDSGQL